MAELVRLSKLTILEPASCASVCTVHVLDDERYTLEKYAQSLTPCKGMKTDPPPHPVL